MSNRNKRFCSICQKETVHLWGGGCLNCHLEELKIEQIAKVKIFGLKLCQASWEREKKEAKAMIEQDCPEELLIFNQIVKQVEKELYPNTVAIGGYRISIWWFVAVIVVIVGAIAWNIWKRKKSENKEEE
jgi:hypothetical protein